MVKHFSVLIFIIPVICSNAGSKMIGLLCAFTVLATNDKRIFPQLHSGKGTNPLGSSVMLVE